MDRKLFRFYAADADDHAWRMGAVLEADRGGLRQEASAESGETWHSGAEIVQLQLGERFSHNRLALYRTTNRTIECGASP